MAKADIISQLDAKYKEICPQYWDFLIKCKEHPTNDKYREIYNYLNSNVDYLETYLKLIEIEDKEEMKRQLEKNNFIKELRDALYEPKEATQFAPNPKVEIVEEPTTINIS